MAMEGQNDNYGEDIEDRRLAMEIKTRLADIIKTRHKGRMYLEERVSAFTEKSDGSVLRPDPKKFMRYAISFTDDQDLKFVARDIERTMCHAETPAIYDLNVFRTNRRLSSSSDFDGRRGFCVVMYLEKISKPAASPKFLKKSK